MWRVQKIASKASAKICEAGLNILNMDAQEEKSRIIIVVEDSEKNIEKAIEAIHSERSKIKFVSIKNKFTRRFRFLPEVPRWVCSWTFIMNQSGVTQNTR